MVAPLRRRSGLNPMPAAAYGYGVQLDCRPSPKRAPRIPQISPNPDEPILLTPAAIVLSLAPANYCNKAR